MGMMKVQSTEPNPVAMPTILRFKHVQTPGRHYLGTGETKDAMQSLYSYSGLQLLRRSDSGFQYTGIGSSRQVTVSPTLRFSLCLKRPNPDSW